MFQNHAKKLPNVSSEILEKQRFSTASVACGCCSKTAWKNHLPGGKHRASEGRASSEETGPNRYGYVQYSWCLNSKLLFEFHDGLFNSNLSPSIVDDMHMC